MPKDFSASFKDTISDLLEFVHLLGINIAFQTRNFLEFIRTAFRYYSCISFAKIDLTLLATYLFNNPFLISKRFLKEKGAHNVYAYGETPYTTLDEIVRECQITKSDTVFELGCGRGRTCFWLHSFVGCKVVGIEYIQEFVTRANEIKERFKVQDVEFRLQDMLMTDYTEATVIYLYGTSLEDDMIRKLITKFQKLAVGTKVITISYPLTDYTSQPDFEVMKRFSVRFPWGTTDAYLQIRK